MRTTFGFHRLVFFSVDCLFWFQVSSFCLFGFLMSHLCLLSFLPFPAVFYLHLSSLPAPSLSCFNFSLISSSGSSVTSTPLYLSTPVCTVPHWLLLLSCMTFLHCFPSSYAFSFFIISCPVPASLTSCKSSFDILSLKSSLLSSLCLGPPLKPV